MAEKTKWMWEASSYQDGWYHKRVLAGKIVPDPSELELPDTLVSKIGTNGNDVVVTEFNTLDNSETKYTLGLGDTFTPMTAFNTFKNEVYKNYATTNEVAKGYVSTGEFEAFKEEFDISNCVTKDYLSATCPTKKDLTAYIKTTAADSKYLTKASADTIYQPKGNYVKANDLTAYQKTTAADAKYATKDQINGLATTAQLKEVEDKIPTDYVKSEDLTAYATKDQINGKLDTTAFTAYSSNVNNTLTGKLDTTAFNAYSATALTALEEELTAKVDTTAFTAYSSNVNTALNGKLDTTAFNSYSSNVNTALSEKLYISSFNTYSANVNTALEAKVNTTAFTEYTTATNQTIDGITSTLPTLQKIEDMTAYQPKGNYLVADDITGKQDVTAMTAYQLVDDMTAYALESEMDDANHKISAIQDIIHSDDKTLDTIQEIVDFAKNNRDLIDGILTVKQDKSAMTAYYTKTESDGKYLTAHQSLEDYQKIADMTAYQLVNDMSGYYTKEESNNKFLTAHQSLAAYQKITDMTAYQTVEGMTSYQPAGEYLVAKDIEGKQDISGMTAYAKTGDIPTDLFTKASADTLYQPIGNYLVPNDITGKQDITAMTAYQTTAGMTAYVDKTYAEEEFVNRDEYTATIDSLSSTIEEVSGELVDDYLAKDEITFATDSQIEALFTNSVDTDPTEPTDTTPTEPTDTNDTQVDDGSVEWSTANFGSISLMSDMNPETINSDDFTEGTFTPTKEQLDTLVTNSSSFSYNNGSLTITSKSSDVISYNVGHSTKNGSTIVTIPSKTMSEGGYRYALVITKNGDGTQTTEVTTLGDDNIVLTNILIKNK